MEKFSIVEKLNETQVEQLYELFQQMWWAKGRSREEVATMYEILCH